MLQTISLPSVCQECVGCRLHLQQQPTVASTFPLLNLTSHVSRTNTHKHPELDFILSIQFVAQRELVGTIMK